jgi:hypothetical protein
MIEDSCGFSEIVAVCLLVDEDETSINFCIETKSCLEKVQIIKVHSRWIFLSRSNNLFFWLCNYVL